MLCPSEPPGRLQLAPLTPLPSGTTQNGGPPLVFRARPKLLLLAMGFGLPSLWAAWASKNACRISIPEKVSSIQQSRKAGL